MKPSYPTLRRLTLLLAALGCLAMRASGAPNVRFVEIEPVVQTVTLKNFGTSACDIGSWYLSSRGTNISMSNPLQVVPVSGTTDLAPGGELKVRIEGYADFIKQGSDDLALHEPGSPADPRFMVDYVIWGGPGGFRESVAISAGIWALGDFVVLGDLYRYPGNGAEPGPRAGLWSSQRTNIRLLWVEPGSSRFALKNFDSVAFDISRWIFTIGNTSLALSSSLLEIGASSALLAPGDEVTLQLTGLELREAGSAIGIHRGLVTAPEAIVDFVQWIVYDSVREPTAVGAGIWTNNARLESSPIYRYRGDGSETGRREGYWREGGSNGTPAIGVEFGFTTGGLPRLQFTTLPDRRYVVRSSEDLSFWTTVSPFIHASGATADWVDSSPVRCRYYVVVDATP